MGDIFASIGDALDVTQYHEYQFLIQKWEWDRDANNSALDRIASLDANQVHQLKNVEFGSNFTEDRR
ncbi:hypothetical protein BWR17_18220 (plasmid) [Phaeobacter inhibens]|nr:hypothetical protein BWR17_18220 [Phaeobacter inhibens]